MTENQAIRMVSHSDLVDRLNFYSEGGIQVPQLKSSPYTPKFIRTLGNGYEVYRHAGRVLEVKPGELIDEYGNVVDVNKLDEQLRTTLTARR